MSSPSPAPVHDPVTFGRPPVTEVVLAVQFEEPVIDLEVLADFAAHVKRDFPAREQHPPLSPMSEDFSIPPTQPSLSVELGTQFTLPRTWFKSEDNSRLLQVQGDRFVFNWRRPNPDHVEYPRYRQLREAFRDKLDQLANCIGSAGKTLPGTNFCEVTYVNQVSVEISSGVGHPDLGEILEPVVASPPYDFLPAAEDAQYNTRFRIEQPDGEETETARGRMYVAAGPAFRPDGSPIYIVNLSSHIIPLNAHDPSSTWEALDLGREWIVRGFVNLTTKEMHKQWRLEEAPE